MKISRLLGFLFISVCVMATCKNGVAQTVTVNVTASPTTVSYGGEVTVDVSITVSLGSTGLKAITGSCTSAAYGTETLSVEYKTMSPQYTASATFQLEAGTEAETIELTCTVDATFSNNTNVYKGTGSTSFTVMSCSGQATATRGSPDLTSDPGYYNLSWSLSAKMSPAGTPSSSVASGKGIGNTLPSEYAKDCDGDDNDVLPETAPTITANEPVDSESYVTFTWSVSNFKYDATPCDSCDAYPNNYYPIAVSDPIVNSSGGELIGYCAQ